jgi:hypothetical protein
MSGTVLVAAIGGLWLGTGLATFIWWFAWHFLYARRQRGHIKQLIIRHRGRLGLINKQLDLSRSREMKALQKADEAWRLVDEAREAERRAKNQLSYFGVLNRIKDLDLNQPFLADGVSQAPTLPGAVPKDWWVAIERYANNLPTSEDDV